jgi:hypothetical protein
MKLLIMETLLSLLTFNETPSSPILYRVLQMYCTKGRQTLRHEEEEKLNTK